MSLRHWDNSINSVLEFLLLARPSQFTNWQQYKSVCVWLCVYVIRMCGQLIDLKSVHFACEVLYVIINCILWFVSNLKIIFYVKKGFTYIIGWDCYKIKNWLVLCFLTGFSVMYKTSCANRQSLKVCFFFKHSNLFFFFKIFCKTIARNYEFYFWQYFL